ncbi:MAG: hypothetical protein WC867_03655 [Candidatus Pacearchaeota archaeon]|jgi:hypothetical protein
MTDYKYTLNIRNIQSLLMDFELLANETSLKLPTYEPIVSGSFRNYQPIELDCGFRDQTNGYHIGKLRLSPQMAKRFFQYDEFSAYTYAIVSSVTNPIDILANETAENINKKLSEMGYKIINDRYVRENLREVNI